MAQIETYERPRSALTEPPIPGGHLFEFCSRDYWLSLDIRKLLIWIDGISRYLLDPDWVGLGTCVACSVPFNPDDDDERPKVSLSSDDLVFANSGYFLEDFDEENFAPIDLYKFLCWASQRLVWLDQEHNNSEDRS